MSEETIMWVIMGLLLFGLYALCKRIEKLEQWRNEKRAKGDK